jgi:putative effector of murein hydrolase LrgA (UPF0299 family)
VTVRERPGNRYLAGLVIAMALLYFGLAYLATALPWPDRRSPSLIDLILLGILPALATILFGVGSWRAKAGKSAALSAAGLVVLLVGLAALRVRGFLT